MKIRPIKIRVAIRPPRNTGKTEMKTRLLQIVYSNPFVSLDHEDLYTHLTKFYEISCTLGVPDAEEEDMFMRIYPR